ncbi:MAG: hypothetical protein KGH94_00040 [Candidatus Micrarchaeota archaeon]|nr:hypothetical protein [Candidatus Micrarchaeota archaeon]
MNTGMMIGAVIVVLVIIIGAAYVLTGGMHPAATTSTVGYTPLPTVSGTNSSTVTTPTTTAVASSTVMVNSTAYAVELETSSTLGQYLANSTGYTLYTYGNDVPNSGTSACTGACLANWPAFYTANLTLASGLNASDFNVITRSGGALQLTYKGWPLYFFVADHQPGQINGNGVNNFRLATK